MKKKYDGDIRYSELVEQVQANYVVHEEDAEFLLKMFRKDYPDAEDIQIRRIGDFIEELKENEYYYLEEQKIHISGYEEEILEVIDWAHILWNKDQNGEISIYRIIYLSNNGEKLTDQMVIIKVIEEYS